ncbi:MAG: hypothetical protein E7369_05480, partial [Clostridiales bacterium]|nr:hypothetical protein [Clostridiales bacterium]
IYNKIFNANKKDYKCIPFWSWNDKLEKDELVWQIEWMKSQGVGGYFMHARGGLRTEYLGDDWFKCIEACLDAGDRLDMDSWAYDENGWPSGFAGGKLLEDEDNHDRYLTYAYGKFDSNAMASYIDKDGKLTRIYEDGGEEYLNVYNNIGVSTADILNGEVVDKFIAETHEKYKERLGDRFGKSLKGFFTDEPQYYRYHTPYTRVLEGYYKETYGEELLDGIGLMFVEREGYRTFRYRYWKCMQELMLKNFAKKIYDWCNENGIELTGHYIEEQHLKGQMLCCAGIMPFYEYEHIPGIDMLSRAVASPVSPKQASSVARQLGKKRVLTETFAMTGWDVTPTELRRIAEWQYVNGVNLMCQHLLPYSEHGQRKRDYPTHFSWVNPWIRHDFKSFNDYFTNLGYLLGESDEPVSVGLFSPIRSLYFDFKRDDYGQPSEVDRNYIHTASELSRMNIPYHIIDETIMASHARVENGKLIIGNCSYDTIVFPKALTMDRSSEKLFEEFYRTGGKMLFVDSVPEYLEGEEHQYNFKTNTTYDEIIKAQPYSVDDVTTFVQSTYREYNGKKFIYAVNLSETDTYTLTFSGDFKGFEAFDIETLESKKISNTVTFAPYKSYVLFLLDESVENQKPLEELRLDGEFNILSASDNYMTLDKARFSTDGANYSDKVGYMGIFNEMLSRKYNGDLYLKYEFEVKTKPNSLSFLAENMNNISCHVNGNPVEFTGVSDFEKKVFKSDISKFVKVGKNEVVLKINFFEGENVYYALFGENVTETLKNCLAYDTTIEPCYLQGDFGVYSVDGFKDGNEPNVYLADNFYIDAKKTVVSDTVKEGYPFFAGNMTFEKKVVLNKVDYKMVLDGRFCLAEVEINGVKVVKSYFENSFDASKYLKVGENIIRVTLYSGNRNLMGPHHFKPFEEPKAVAPDTFELINTWKDGKSSMERDNYSFVKFGLFKN